MTGLGWMYGRDLPLLSLTFARDLTARQLLERMGADPATLAVRSQDDLREEFEGPDGLDTCPVSAGRYGDWAWAWEHASGRCTEDVGLIGSVSEGTAAVVLHHANGRVEFWYAEGGRLVSAFDSYSGLRPADRFGTDPSRFDSELRSHGANPATGDYGPLGCLGLFLRLGEGLGIGLPHDDLVRRPLLGARLFSG